MAEFKTKVTTYYVQYRVTLVVEYLCWVDLDLGSSPGWWAATVATYCPRRVVEHPKSKSAQPRYSTTRVTLYRVKRNDSVKRWETSLTLICTN